MFQLKLKIILFKHEITLFFTKRKHVLEHKIANSLETSFFLKNDRNSSKNGFKELLYLVEHINFSNKG